MRILLTPNLPASVRALAEARSPPGCTLDILAPSHPGYGEALAAAGCLMGLPRGRIDEAFLARAPRLALIQLLRTGHELVDLAAAARAGVRVATIGDLTAAAVAEHTLMLMLALGRRLRAQHEAVVTGGWLDVKPWQRPGGDVDAVPEAIFDGLAGKTLGVLGLGAIGGRVARLAAAFGMTVQALARPGERGAAEREPEPERGGVPLVPLEALLETSDVISLHLRLSAETANLLDAAAFARMKRGAYLVNTARGELVDEAALLGALERGQLAGAALDTLRQEPPPAGHPLLGRADVLFTPHTAWLTRESWRRTLELAFGNVERLRAGQPLQHEVGSLGRMTP